MLQPQARETTFLVAFYNKVVRALVKDNRSHDYFEDHWADIHVQDVTAQTESEARSILQRRFPPEDGFVIDHVDIAHG